MADPFIRDRPAAEALAAWLETRAAAGCPARVPQERLGLEAAIGRVTAEAVWARRSSPAYDTAAMDGIAVRAVATVGASPTTPLLLAPGDFATVDTGERAQIAGEMAAIMHEEVPAVIPWFQDTLSATRDNVSGYDSHPANFVDFRSTTVG